MTIRVVQWSTGNVGRNCIAGILAKPGLELVGVFVSSDAKVGMDAGELARLDVVTGVKATNDADALIALKPDIIVHTSMADDRLFEALEDLEKFLLAGINVITSSPVFLLYPQGMDSPEMVQPVIDAATKGGVSIHMNGVDPGFANDILPLTITSISERIDEVRCSEVLNYNTYNQWMILHDVMGFGKALDDETSMLLMDGVLVLAWGAVVRQIAAALDLELDEVTQFFEKVAAPEDIQVDAGVIPKGTQAGLRFEVRGMVNGVARVVLEHVTRTHDDLAPHWPQPAGQGCYRVEVKGEPNYTVDLQLMGEDGDHNTGGLKATAMRLVNAVPAVVAAEPGLITIMDLPTITGAGLVNTASA